MIKRFIRGFNGSRDLLIVLDSSGSIGETAFHKSLQDIYKLISVMCPSPEPFVKSSSHGYNQLGLLQFSTGVKTSFTFGEVGSLSEIKGKLNSIQHMAGTTCTEKALSEAIKNMDLGKIFIVIKIHEGKSEISYFLASSSTRI